MANGSLEREVSDLPAARISMRVTREILRLRFDLGRSHREIGRAVKKSPATVGDCLMRFRVSGLSWPVPEELDDWRLEEKLYPPPPPDSEERPVPNWEDVSCKLSKKHVTLALLSEEYYRSHSEKEPYQYTWFCKEFREWSRKTSVTMRQFHKAGEKMFVDWAGSTVPLVNAKTGEVTDAQIFVATLGLSSYTYVEACENQKPQLGLLVTPMPASFSVECLRSWSQIIPKLE